LSGRTVRGGALAALFLASLTAPTLATGIGTGTATIVDPITVASNSSLRFGTIVKPASGSITPTISTAGVASGYTPTGSNAFGNADFTVSGTSGASVTVTVDSSFNMTSGANSLTVNTTATHTGTQTLTGGTLDVAVGGSTTVLSTTPSGAYTGSFNVTAAYN